MISQRHLVPALIPESQQPRQAIPCASILQEIMDEVSEIFSEKILKKIWKISRVDSNGNIREISQNIVIFTSHRTSEPISDKVDGTWQNRRIRW